MNWIANSVIPKNTAMMKRATNEGTVPHAAFYRSFFLKNYFLIALIILGNMRDAAKPDSNPS